MGDMIKTAVVFAVFLALIPMIALLGKKETEPEPQPPAYTERELILTVMGQMPADYPPEALKAQAVLVRSCLEAGREVRGMTEEELKAYYGDAWTESFETVSRAVEEAPWILTWEGKPAQVCWHPYNGGMTVPGSQPYLTAVSSPEKAPGDPGDWDCIGMSQLGAKQMAEDGAAAGDILSHYFPGTKMESVGNN